MPKILTIAMLAATVLTAGCCSVFPRAPWCDEPGPPVPVEDYPYEGPLLNPSTGSNAPPPSYTQEGS